MLRIEDFPLGFMARTLEFSGPFSEICMNTQQYLDYSCVSLHARIIVYASSFHAVFSNLKLTQTQTDTRNHMPCFNKGAVADTFRVLKETSFMFAMLKETYVG